MPEEERVSRAEFDALVKKIDRMAGMVEHLHDVFMIPSPGNEKTLLDRFAAITILIESGSRSAAIIIKLAALIAALGAFWTVFITFSGRSS